MCSASKQGIEIFICANVHIAESYIEDHVSQWLSVQEDMGI